MSDPDTIFVQRPPAVLTFGTPESPAVSVPSPIVMIRPAGPRSSELYVRTGGGEIITVPLNYGLLINLLEDATAGLRRCEETR